MESFCKISDNPNYAKCIMKVKKHSSYTYFLDKGSFINSVTLKSCKVLKVIAMMSL